LSGLFRKKVMIMKKIFLIFMSLGLFAMSGVFAMDLTQEDNSKYFSCQEDEGLKIAEKTFEWILKRVEFFLETLDKGFFIRQEITKAIQEFRDGKKTKNDLINILGKYLIFKETNSNISNGSKQVSVDVIVNPKWQAKSVDNDSADDDADLGGSQPPFFCPCSLF